MTQTNTRLLDEFARLATDAAAVAQGVRREAETTIRAQAERLMSEMNMVHRDEFEAMKEAAVKAAEDVRTLSATVDALSERVGALEAKIAGSQPS